MIGTATRYWAGNQTHQYFKTVQRLTPKTYAQKPHLRGPDSGGDATAATVHVRLVLGLTSGFSLLLVRSPILADHIEFELSDLQGRKAVPSHSAPSFA